MSRLYVFAKRIVLEKALFFAYRGVVSGVCVECTRVATRGLAESSTRRSLVVSVFYLFVLSVLVNETAVAMPHNWYILQSETMCIGIIAEVKIMIARVHS